MRAASGGGCLFVGFVLSGVSDGGAGAGAAGRTRGGGDGSGTARGGVDGRGGIDVPRASDSRAVSRLRRRAHGERRERVFLGHCVPAGRVVAGRGGISAIFVHDGDSDGGDSGGAGRPGGRASAGRAVAGGSTGGDRAQRAGAGYADSRGTYGADGDGVSAGAGTAVDEF